MIVVVGAGPAGLAAAWRAAERGHEVTVLEAADHVGGMAASRTVAGLRVDHGSHRLHPAADPALLADLGRLLGDDLQVRPRHGRLRLAGRWVGFPLRTGDLLRSVPPSFAARAALDAATGPLRRPRGDTFDAVLRAGLGPAVVDGFYGPYARKLWDADPTELSGELARRRVSASGPVAIARKLVRGARPEGRTFLYPRRGFGQIAEAVADAAVAAGATIRLSTPATAIEVHDDRVVVDGIAAATVLTTAPAPAVLSMLGEPAPPASGALRIRAMVVAWLVLDTPRWTDFDAHYLPDPAHPVARLSEPKNYRDSAEDPAGTTVLCAELPCWEGGDLWAASPTDVGRVVVDALAHEGLRVPAPVDVELAHLPRVYPRYAPGFEWGVAAAESAVAAAGRGRVALLGRQGLFVPDNIHHVLAMGRSAADSLRPDGTLDPDRWSAARAGFRVHVVED